MVCMWLVISNPIIHVFSRRRRPVSRCMPGWPPWSTSGKSSSSCH